MATGGGLRLVFSALVRPAKLETAEPLENRRNRTKGGLRRSPFLLFSRPSVYLNPTVCPVEIPDLLPGDLVFFLSTSVL